MLLYSRKLRGVQFTRIVDLYYFVGLNCVDKSTNAHYVLYNQVFFAGLIFAVRQSSMKTTKIGLLENLPLYGIYINLEKSYTSAGLYIGFFVSGGKS